ncbi:MAG: Holliday junction branch migration protein RuvA [Alphaproteobacteria bacterium]|nr:Holliday junction branch migration protein RuvA [Alphaproteobacteria bacterium]
MIGKIQGIIDTVQDNQAIIMVGGVGYLVWTPARLSPGNPATLWIETHVREDEIRLFGFLSNDDKGIFNLLTSVQGVGPKAALSIMTTLSTSNIIKALAAQDKTSFTAAPGVGPKVAERIVTELKSKIKNLAAGATPEIESNIMTDAVAALEGLGYKRIAIVPAVREILDKNPDAPLDQIITQSLKVL